MHKLVSSGYHEGDTLAAVLARSGDEARKRVLCHGTFVALRIQWGLGSRAMKRKQCTTACFATVQGNMSGMLTAAVHM